MRRRALRDDQRVLIIDDGERWTAITQPAHAWLAGQAARAWGNAEFAAPEPLEDVCLGTAQHDVAWSDYDRRPPLRAEAGRAASFIEAPTRERHVIWHDAPARVLAQSPWAALLVSLHGTNIHTRYIDPSFLPGDEAALIARYLGEQRALQDRLIALLGTDRARAERQGELLFCLDALSLSLCHGWPERELPPVDGAVVHYRPAGERQATLDPWPLRADRLELTLHARTFTERFADEAALHAALGAKPYQARTFILHRYG